MTFLIIQLILLLLVLYPFLNQLFLYKKKQKLQEKLYKENLKVNPNIYKICINSEKFYKKILKFNIIENLGILIINEKNIKIQFYDKYNTLNEVLFNKEELINNNLDKSFNKFNLGGGNLHWLNFKNDINNIYITADTNLIAIKSREKTNEIVNKIFYNIENYEYIDNKGFQLQKNKVSLGATIFLIFMLLMILLNIFFSNYTSLKINLTQILIVNIIVALCFLPLSKFFMKNKIPNLESFGLSLFIILIHSFFSPIYLKHFNTFNKKENLATFKLDKEKRLLIDENNNKIFYSHRIADYWNTFEDNSEHKIPIINGRFNTFYYNQTNLNVRYKIYYMNKK